MVKDPIQVHSVPPRETAPKASLVAQSVKNPPAMQETWLRFLGWEDSLEEQGIPWRAAHSSVLVWRIPMDRGAWRAAVRGVAKSWTGPSS